MYNIPFTGNLTKPAHMIGEGTDNVRALFTLAVEKGRQDNRTTEYFDFTAYGSTAENMKAVPKGTRLNVQANLGQYKKEIEGQEYPITILTLSAQEVSPSLRWATAEITKTAGKGTGGASKSKAAARDEDDAEEAPKAKAKAPARSKPAAQPADDEEDIF